MENAKSTIPTGGNDMLKTLRVLFLLEVLISGHVISNTKHKDILIDESIKPFQHRFVDNSELTYMIEVAGGLPRQ